MRPFGFVASGDLETDANATNASEPALLKDHSGPVLAPGATRPQLYFTPRISLFPLGASPKGVRDPKTLMDAQRTLNGLGAIVL